MAMTFESLDVKTRMHMVREIELDISTGNLYISKRFNDIGKSVYPSLFLEAARNHDEDWLSDELNRLGCFNSGEFRSYRNGKASVAQTPFTAAETLAEGEFNRFYMRAVCLRAIEEGIPEVLVYRGKAVLQPRPESQALLGTKIPASPLLDDLRCPPGTRTQYGLPAGPNSGITICLEC